MTRTSILTALLIIAVCALPADRAWAHIGTGIAVDSNGRVCFADTIHNCIWRIDGDGKLTLLATDQHTNGLAAHEDGSLYIVEGAVRRITPLGGATEVPSSAEFQTVAGPAFAMDRQGNIYFLKVDAQCKGEYKIMKRTPEGTISLLAGSDRGYADGKGAEAKFSHLNSAACGPDGSLYVRDGNSIRKVPPGGTVSTLTGGAVAGFVGTEEEDLQRPLGLAVDATGYVYVAHYWKRRVFKVTPCGEVSTLAQTTWPWIPTGVAVAMNDVYILERLGNPYAWSSLLAALFFAENLRVRKISSGGRITTLATVRGWTKFSFIAWALFLLALSVVFALVLTARWLLSRAARRKPGQWSEYPPAVR